MKYIFLILVTPLSLWRAFLMQIMWVWFFVPLGIPEVTVVHLMGIDLLTGWIVRGFKKTNTRTDEEYAELISDSIFYPGVVFAIAWLIHFFM